MKKLILSLLMITMLTGCVSEPVKQEEVITAEVTTQAETIGNIDLDEEIKAYFTKELAGCMWEMLDEIGYFESETKNTEKSAYSFKDVNSDGKEDLIWRVSEYKFDYICVFILSDETVADSTYYLAGGSDGESDVIVHENNICEFISDTSSLWNEAKWHQYVDMSDFSVKLETMKTVSYDTEEENFYVIENDEQISVSEEEYKKSPSLARSRAIMIGDDFANDIEGAQIFGIDQFYYNPYHKPCDGGPTYESDNLLDLIKQY